MAHRARIYDVVLMALLLYLIFTYTESLGTNSPACSLGDWLPWDCSCCGGSRNPAVYRIRAKCCVESICVKLRVDAIKITSTKIDYRQDGTCDRSCQSQFGSHHGNPCISKIPTLEEITWPSMKNSCLSRCAGIITTTTTPHQSIIIKTKSTAPAPTVESSPGITMQTASNTNRTTTTLSVPSSEVTSGHSGGDDTLGLSGGNVTHSGNSFARVTVNCHLVLGIALAATAVFVLY